MTSTPTLRDPKDLPTQYAPAQVEGPLYERWVKAGYFEVDADVSAKPPYCIVIPPPNVTGSLHLGHAFEHTLIDALIRRQRMQGYETLWQPGMDHAGIATQNVVERELASEGLSRHDLGREAFVERVWQWKAESGGQILGQMRRLGDSVAWSRERFTMDEGLTRAVLTIFKRLYDDGLIYRAERIINWCPRCLTALSDIEVEHRRTRASSSRSGTADGRPENSIVVATTRAETMLGDTAVAVHPDDERYAHLVGTEVELPLTGRRIPVVADEHVDPEFGTGAVKVTPAHDPNDFEIGRRHSLPSLIVLDERGNITANGPFLGLDRFEARPAVVAALREQEPHRRGEAAVPPLRRSLLSLRHRRRAAAVDAVVRQGRTAGQGSRRRCPRRTGSPSTREHGAALLRLGRQRCTTGASAGSCGGGTAFRCGTDRAARSSASGRARNRRPAMGWTQDPDVLDTWFSSALWPFSTLGWPDETPELEKFYPNTVLVTGYDILFFWVVRMMMFGLYAMDGVQPFDIVPLHGMLRDSSRQEDVEVARQRRRSDRVDGHVRHRRNAVHVRARR